MEATQEQLAAKGLHERTIVERSLHATLGVRNNPSDPSVDVLQTGADLSDLLRDVFGACASNPHRHEADLFRHPQANFILAEASRGVSEGAARRFAVDVPMKQRRCCRGKRRVASPCARSRGA